MLDCGISRKHVVIIRLTIKRTVKEYIASMLIERK